MSLANKRQTALTGGEISPTLWDRPDLVKHQSGAKKMLNYYAHVEGGASNRTGTEVQAKMTAKGYFIPFELSNDDTYMLYFTGPKIHVFRDKVDLEYSIDAPYTYEEIPYLSFSQSYDTIIIRHVNHDEWRLERYADTDWALVQRGIRGGPYLPVNVDRSSELTVKGESWDDTALYRDGDVVQIGDGNPKSITAAAYVWWYSKRKSRYSTYQYYLTRLTVGASHGISVDDTVEIRGMTGSGGHNFDGNYTVKRVGSDYIDINTSRYALGGKWYNNHALPSDFTGATATPPAASPDLGFYSAIKLSDNEFSPSRYRAQVSQNDEIYLDSGELALISVSDEVWLYLEDQFLGVDAKYTVQTKAADHITINRQSGSYDYSAPNAFIPVVYHGDLNLNKDPDTATDHWRKTYSSHTVNIDSTARIFSADDVGRLVRMTGNWLADTSGERDYNDGTITSEAIPVWGNVTIETGGAWGGILEVLQSNDDGTTYSLADELEGMSGTKNYSHEMFFPEPGTLIKIRTYNWTSIANASNRLTWQVIGDNASTVEMVIDEYVDEGRVKALVSHGLLVSFTSWRWELGAYGGDQKYPAATTFYQQRKVDAGTDRKQMTVFHTKTGNYIDYSDSDQQLATEGFAVDIEMAKQYDIRHLVPLKDLLVLTSGSWHALSPVDGVYGPTDFDHKLHGYGGASATQKPIIFGLSVLMVHEDDRTVSELRFDWNASGYDRTRVDVMSKHLFEGKTITGFAKQEDPNHLIWVTFSDGTGAIFTFLREQEVWGWTPIEWNKGSGLIPASKLLTCGSVKRPAGIDDDVYFLVERGSEYFIETLTSRDQGVFLDGACTTPANDNNTSNSVDTPYPQNTQMYVKCYDTNGNLALEKDNYVTNQFGTLVVSGSYDRIVAGFPYETQLTTLDAELAEGMSSAGRKKNVKRVVLGVSDDTEADDLQIGPDEDSLTPAEKNNDGDIDMVIPGDWSSRGSVTIKQKTPGPVTIKSITPFFERSE